MKTKFALPDFMGNPIRYYSVDMRDLSASAPSVARKLAHLIMVIDCSGSMYIELENVKATVEKVLTIGEYKDADLKVSVVSYSGSGDCVVHVDRATISDVMTPAGVQKIRSLRTRGLTCISQGLRAAKTLYRAGETTCVLLHTDGYTNDRSPGAEKREIDDLLVEYQKLPEVFINTVAYSTWSDFKLLAYIANAASGVCYLAPTAKELTLAIEESAALVAGQTVPALEIPLNGGNYATFLSSMARKVIGTAGTALSVRGIRAEDDREAYIFTSISREEFEALSVPNTPEKAILAFAAAKAAEGRLNEAKFAVVATCNQTLLAEHARALTNDQVAAFVAGLQSALFDKGNVYTYSKMAALDNVNAPSVKAILDVLAQYGGQIELDLPSFMAQYKRRGVKRIAGTRQEDGSILQPSFALKGWGPVKVSAFNVNRNNATCNMLATQAADLVSNADGAVISTVSSVDLKLSKFNNYTIVGDGMLNVETLPLKLGSKRLYADLQKLGAVDPGTYNPAEVYTVRLDGRPLVPYNANFDPAVFNGLFGRAAGFKTLISILNACLKTSSDDLTAEQIVALNAHNLSKSLNFNAPTTTEYTDLQAALADGSVDSRISYKIDFGTQDLLNLADLYSANEYLARRFTMAGTGVGTGVDSAKPKLDTRWGSDVVYGVKTLTARTKLNAADAIMYPVFEDFLGTKLTGAVGNILKDAGADADEIAAFYAAAHGKVSEDDAVRTFTDTLRKLDQGLDNALSVVSDIVFYIGSTGLLPDSFGDLRGYSADDAKAAFPNLSIPKAAADGTFYNVSGTILSIYPKVEYFSTKSAGKVDPTQDAE